MVPKSTIQSYMFEVVLTRTKLNLSSSSSSDGIGSLDPGGGFKPPGLKEFCAHFTSRLGDTSMPPEAFPMVL